MLISSIFFICIIWAAHLHYGTDFTVRPLRYINHYGTTLRYDFTVRPLRYDMYVRFYGTTYHGIYFIGTTLRYDMYGTILRCTTLRYDMNGTTSTVPTLTVRTLRYDITVRHYGHDITVRHYGTILIRYDFLVNLLYQPIVYKRVISARTNTKMSFQVSQMYILQMYI